MNAEGAALLRAHFSQKQLDFIGWLFDDIGVPLESFVSLLKDDEWTILIKWHAILETCVNALLTHHFKEPKANKAFARLEMSNPKTGKMAFVSACEPLSPEMRIFIQKLSEMRNYAVHDIKHFGFNFDEYLAVQVKDRDRAAWIRQVCFAFPSFAR